MAENTACYAKSSMPGKDGAFVDYVVLCNAPRKYTTPRNWANAKLVIKAALGANNWSVANAFPARSDGAPILETDKGASADAVLEELLNTAYQIGIGQTADTRPNRDAYTVLGFDDVNATGAFNVSSPVDKTTKHAEFKIHAPPTKARSIVIVITVGGVKIKITIRW
jgi:hypothetical protein